MAHRADAAARDSEERARREAGLDEQERESFPASDPHSDWAGGSPGVEFDRPR